MPLRSTSVWCTRGCNTGPANAPDSGAATLLHWHTVSLRLGAVVRELRTGRLAVAVLWACGVRRAGACARARARLRLVRCEQSVLLLLRTECRVHALTPVYAHAWSRQVSGTRTRAMRKTRLPKLLPREIQCYQRRRASKGRRARKTWRSALTTARPFGCIIWHLCHIVFTSRGFDYLASMPHCLY